MKRCLKLFIISIFILNSGCGFHLNSANTASRFDSLKSLELKQHTPFTAVLFNELVKANIKFIQQSPYSLEIMDEQYTENILSTNARNIVREKMITLNVRYKLYKNNKVILKPTTLTSQKVIFLNNVDVYNSQAETKQSLQSLHQQVAKLIYQDISNKLTQDTMKK